MSLTEFVQTPYGRDFFRSVQKISDSLEEIAKGKESKSMHEHRVGAAQRISLAVDYLNKNLNIVVGSENPVFTKEKVIQTLEEVREILLKSA
jgi:hypothetical protein